MAFAQLSEVKLEYFDHGQGPETVVFVHGFQASARIWQKVQEALPADRYRSIAINNRGAGQSDAPADEAEFSIQCFASDVHELVTQLGFTQFTLAGHSLGGATVAEYAVNHPGMLKGLILLDPADPDGREMNPEEIEAFLDQRMEARRAQLARGGGGDGIDATGAGASDEQMQLLTADINAAPERRLRGSMRSMFTMRLGEKVKDLPMPVLLAGGDQDALIPLPAMLATWAKYPKGTSLHIWHGMGHSPNLDMPEKFAALVRRFVEVTIPARAG